MDKSGAVSSDFLDSPGVVKGFARALAMERPFEVRQTHLQTPIQAGDGSC